MERRVVSGIVLALSMFILLSIIQPIKATSPSVHNTDPSESSTSITEMVPDWYLTPDPCTDADVAYDVAVDSENNIIVVGLDRSVDSGQWRIMKLDNEGNEVGGLWPYVFNPTDGWDEPKSVAVDAARNIIVVGRYQPKGEFSKWGMKKFDENANLIWEKIEDFPPVSGGNWKDLPEDVAVDEFDNSIIVVGYDQQEGLTMGNWRVIKYDSTVTGNEIFNRQYSEAGHNIAYGVGVQSDRSIIVVGTARSETTKNDWKIKKLDPDTGDVIPGCDKILLQTPENDAPVDVAVDSEDNIIVVGHEAVTSSSNTKWRIIKLDSNCNEIGSWDGDWSTSQDSAMSVAVDSHDNFVVVGADRNADDMKWRIMKFGSGTPIAVLWEDTVNPTPPIPERWDLERANGVAVLEGVNITVVGSDDSPTPDHDRRWRIAKFAGPHVRLVGTGWGKMSVRPGEHVCGPAQLYNIEDEKMGLIVTYGSNDYSRTWNIISQKEHKCLEKHMCYSEEWGSLVVKLLKHRREQFWHAAGRGAIASGP